MIPLSDDNPTRRMPVISVTLISACIAVFAYQFLHSAGSGPSFTASCGFIPYEFLTGKDLPPFSCVTPVQATILTSMFMHGGFLHLGGNMLYLWIFGNNIEDTLGRRRFAVFYVVCGLAAALTQTALTLFTAPEEIGIPMVGASGAIAGVLGAYLIRYPTARVRTLVTFGFYWRTIQLPAFLVLGGWFVLQFFQGVASLGGSSTGGVAVWAHIGGFVAGLLLITPLVPRRQPG
jgi:membrane associated rhomboid family serine protease